MPKRMPNLGLRTPLTSLKSLRHTKSKRIKRKLPKPIFSIPKPYSQYNFSGELNTILLILAALFFSESVP